MTTAASHPANRWLPTRESLARILSKEARRALVGVHIVAAVVILTRSDGWWQWPELIVYDTLRTARTQEAPRDRIVLIGQTDPDLIKRLYNHPLTDGEFADLLERVASWHPRVIAVDIYRDIPQPPGTERLAAVLKAHPEIVWGFKHGDGTDKNPRLAPPAPLAGTNRIALVDLPTDDHGKVVRRGLLFAADEGKNYPSLGWALARGYLARDHILLKPGPDGSLLLGKATLPLLNDKRGPYINVDSGGYQVLLEYYGGAKPFELKTIGDTINNDLSALVADKAVLIGDMLVSSKDYVITPFNTGLFRTSQDVYGSEVHAHLADQLIEQALTGAPPLEGWSRSWEDVWIWGWAVAGALLGLSIRSVYPALAGSAAGVMGLTAIVYVAFGRALLLPFLPAAFAWLAAGGLTNQLLYFASNRDRKRLRRSFSLYLSPHYVEELVKNPEKLVLGGEIKTMTIMFCDIRGFTSMSEGMTSHELGQLINEFLTPMTDIIMERKGTVDKYIGDCIMAFWNAPLDDPDHAKNAVAAAQEMRRKLVELNAGWAAEGRRTINIGIGINTGECSVGNFGSRQRMNYSLLGDPVNLSSRLEGLTKVYGVDMILGEDTAALLDEPDLIELDLVAVKGKSRAVRIYTLPPYPVETQQYVARHAALLAAYRRRDWDAALGLLEDPVLAAEREMAPVYGLFRERIEQLKDEPPPPDWDGVFVAHEK